MPHIWHALRHTHHQSTELTESDTHHVVEADAPSLEDDLTRECTQHCEIELKQIITAKYPITVAYKDFNMSP